VLITEIKAQSCASGNAIKGRGRNCREREVMVLSDEILPEFKEGGAARFDEESIEP
jgi:hypothetical protein